MSDVVSLTVEIPRELGARLAEMARDAKRSEADLAGEAIASFVEHNADQIAEIRRALEEAESGSPGIPHEDIERWIDSWGTDHELPVQSRNRSASPEPHRLTLRATGMIR